MDTVTELAARATTYLVLVQEAARQAVGVVEPLNARLRTLPTPRQWREKAEEWFATGMALRKRAHELSVTATLTVLTAESDDEAWFAGFRDPATELLEFVATWDETSPVAPSWHASAAATTALNDTADTIAGVVPGPLPGINAPDGVAAEAWRRWLHRLLHQHPAERQRLAELLHLVPGLVWTALTAPIQRAPAPKADTLLRATLHAPLKEGPIPRGATARALLTGEPTVRQLLTDDATLRAELAGIGWAVPFALAFPEELADVQARRAKFARQRAESAREGVAGSSDSLASAATTAAHDAALGGEEPFEQAKQLGLVGLAFSGGGIRSATFNLGILQRLAQVGWLPKIDYLSTVSGGGYIGSWLAAWVLRLGSINDVAARLDYHTAPNPLAEETRPLRWLRQYSNHLAPQASFFTPDAWTIGTTWLRNTVLNQLVFFLVIAGVLGLGYAFMGYWQLPLRPVPVLLSPAASVGAGLGQWWFVGLLFLGVAGVAGWGMRAFHAPPTTAEHRERWVPLTLLGLAWAAAWTASTLLRQTPPPAGFGLRLLLLAPVGAYAFVAMLLTAALGGYADSFAVETPFWQRWLRIGLSTLAGAIVGVILLAAAWELLAHLSTDVFFAGEAPGWQDHLGVRLTFVVGPPVLLEVGALTIIARMALLGEHFPDERREWWGRLGAVLHLTIAAWVLVTGSVLLSDYLTKLVTIWYKTALATAGGTVAVVLAGVRLAAGGETSAQSDTPDAAPRWVTWLIAVAPYAFILAVFVAEAKLVNDLLTDPDSWVRRTVDRLYQTAPLRAAGQWLLPHNPLGVPDREHLFFTEATAWVLGGLLLGALGLGLGAGLARCLGVNEFSLHHFYRNRLVRAYLGASRRREEREVTANPFTQFDVGRDDVPLARLAGQATTAASDPAAAGQYDGPYLLINTALNATHNPDLTQQNRLAESFVFSPRYCGFDISRVRGKRSAQAALEYGYQPTALYTNRSGGPTLGTAMAISGAAVNPNWGYHSSPAMAFLLTLFNVRLGWWLGNPCRDRWQESSPRQGLLYLLRDLAGQSSTDSAYVCLSDGGHFDNMGLYELVRRRCTYVIVGDGEEDAAFRAEGIANAIRRCRIDFGVDIHLDLRPLTYREDDRHSAAHYAVGRIHYPDGLVGHLLYLKASLTGNEPTDVGEYAQQNATFPHEATFPDQFFSEQQFESYRRLGMHVAADALRAVVSDQAALADPATYFTTLASRPPLPNHDGPKP